MHLETGCDDYTVTCPNCNSKVSDKVEPRLVEDSSNVYAINLVWKCSHCGLEKVNYEIDMYPTRYNKEEKQWYYAR